MMSRGENLRKKRHQEKIPIIKLLKWNFKNLFIYYLFTQIHFPSRIQLVKLIVF